MQSLFNLTKIPKYGQCDAVRCLESSLSVSVTSALWELYPERRVYLCAKHRSLAESFAEESGFKVSDAVVVAQREEEGAKIVGFSESKAIRDWFGRLRDLVEYLKDQDEESRRVLVQIQKLSKVEDQDRLEEVASWAQEVKTNLKTVTELEKETTKPLEQALTIVRKLFKFSRKAWADSEHLLRAHLEASALEQEERNREIQDEALSLVRAGGDPTEVLSRMTHSAGLPGVSLRPKWLAKVEDVELLPAEFVVKTPNHKRLKEYCSAVPEGAEPEPVAGVEFVRDVDSRIQTVKS